MCNYNYSMKRVIILTIVLFVTISVVVIIGNVITIGEKFTTVFGTSYVEYVFYILLIGLFIYLVYYAIFEPMMRIHNAPEFPVLAIEGKEEDVPDKPTGKDWFLSVRKSAKTVIISPRKTEKLTKRN